MADEHSEWMRRAVVEARGAAASGDVPVGALVFDASGRLLAAAHNERELLQDPTAHAEILALRAAARALGDWQLLGPCPAAGRRHPGPVAAGRLHPGGDPRAVPDVRRCDSGGSGSGGRVRRLGRKGRRRGVGA